MRTRQLLEELWRKVDRMELALIVRDPGTSLSADAYDGLRKQVAVAARDRQAHLAHLAQLDETLRATSELEAVRGVVSEFMQQAGIVALEDANRPEAYDVVAGKGARLDVLSPAYVEESTGRLIRRGRARASDTKSEHQPADAVEVQTEWPVQTGPANQDTREAVE